MRLAVVTNILTPYRIPLFEALHRRVEEFTVLLMAGQEENREWALEGYGFRAEVLPGIHVRPPGHAVSMHCNYGVIRRLIRVAPDVVLSGGFGPANIAALLYCMAFRKKFVGWGELMIHPEDTASAVRTMVRRWLTRWSDGSIASSSAARDAFLRYGTDAERVLTCLMPIDVDRFARDTREFRAKPDYETLQARYSRPILLSVGQIVRRKGYPELFRMYRRVLDTWPQASLIIVGDGPERLQYENDAASWGLKNVHFVGFQPASQLVRFLAIADVFVFPTLYDPFGAVLSEAMAAGLPVVSSVHAAATRDLVEDGVSGFRIDPHDTEASVSSLLKVLALEPEQRRALGQAAYRRVKEGDITTAAESMVTFMQSLVAASACDAGHLVRCGR